MKNKNNYSLAHKSYLRKIKRNKALIMSTQLIILVSFFTLWEVFARVGWIDVFFFSSPSRMWDVCIALSSSGELYTHIWVTLKETLIAFVIASILGFIIAGLLWQNDFIRRVLEPYLVVLNSLPKVALGPLIIIWVGTGQSSIITMAVLIVVIVTTLNILTAFMSVEESKISLLRSFGASKWQIFRHLVIPASRSDIISTLKINVGLSWVGAIMGEYLICRAGLGYLLIYGSQSFQLDLVMLAVLLLCILAAIMYAGVALLEKYINRMQ